MNLHEWSEFFLWLKFTNGCVFFFSMLAIVPMFFSGLYAKLIARIKYPFLLLISGSFIGQAIFWLSSGYIEGVMASTKGAGNASVAIVVLLMAAVHSFAILTFFYCVVALFRDVDEVVEGKVKN